MARQSALAHKSDTRAPRPRLRPRLRVVALVHACDVTVVHHHGDLRVELHRNGKKGRGCWLAVVVIGGELHDARQTRYRWQALAQCHAWMR